MQTMKVFHDEEFLALIFSCYLLYKWMNFHVFDSDKIDVALLLKAKPGPKFDYYLAKK